MGPRKPRRRSATQLYRPPLFRVDAPSCLCACATQASRRIFEIGCALAGLPYRRMGSTSVAVNRRTSRRYGNSKTGCSQPIGCHDVACSGFSHRQVPSSWWQKLASPSRASPSCCFAPPAASRGSIPSRSPQNIPAVASRRPCWPRRRKPRCRANARPCGLKSMKKITVPSRFIVRPAIVNSADTINIMKIVAMRSGSRSTSYGHDAWGHACARSEIHLAPAGRIGILCEVAFRFSRRGAKAIHAQKGARP